MWARNRVRQERVQAQLERILTSPQFSQAGRQAALLRFLVESDLRGDSGALKETVIAAEVYREPAYDPKADSFVRVDVGRLRQRLRDYYAERGAADPIRITIPKGRYAPAFEVAKPERSLPWRWIGAAVAGVALTSGLFWWRGGTRAVEEATGKLALSVIAAEGPPPLAKAMSAEVELALRNLGYSLAETGGVGMFRISAHREEGAVFASATLASQTDDPFWRYSYKVAGGEQEARTAFRVAFQDRIRLELPRTLRALAKPLPQDREARRLYLLGVQERDQGGAEDFEEALQHFEAAARIEPALGETAVQQARTLLWLAFWGDRDPSEALARARTLLARAPQSSPPVREMLAYSRLFADFNWGAAEGAVRAAIASGGDVESRQLYAKFLLLPQGRFDRAADELRIALAETPHENALCSELAEVYVRGGMFDLAAEPIRRARELARTAPATEAVPGMLAASKGDFDAAIRHFEAGVSRRRAPWVLGHLGYSLARRGRSEEALAIVAELERSGQWLHVDRAAVLAGLSRVNDAIDLLREAAKVRSPAVVLIGSDYRFRNLRAKPEFQALLRSMYLE